MNDRWGNQIDEITANFKLTFGTLTVEQLNWKPGPDVWSIGQNVDHLIVINKTYYPVIESVMNGTYKLPWIGKFGFMVSFFGRMILQSVQPDRKRKMKTFPMWQPARSDIPADILNRFEKQQEELKRLIASSAGLVEKATIISSPANKNIVYKLETAFDIIVAHERRHLEQAREMKAMLPS